MTICIVYKVQLTKIFPCFCSLGQNGDTIWINYKFKLPFSTQNRYHLYSYYREISDFGLDELTSLSLSQYIKAEVWEFPVMTERMRLISYLLYGLFSTIVKKNTIKLTGSNFQHPLVHARGHSRSCSLNRNKPGDAIETTRQ